MRRAAAVVVGIVAAILAISAFVLLFLPRTDWGRERIRRYVVRSLQQRVHGTVVIGRIEGDVFAGPTLVDVRIADSAGVPVFAAERITFRYSLGALLHEKIDISRLEIVRPLVNLDQPPGGEWNFRRVFASRGPSDSTQGQSGFGRWVHLANVSIAGGRFVLRRPWTPDTTLARAARDSVIAAALSGASRERVERVAGGFQRVIEVHDITAKLPFARAADPDSAAKRLDIASLAMIGEPYRPPVVDVRALSGTVLATRDSVWWRGGRIALPGTALSTEGAVALGKSSSTTTGGNEGGDAGRGVGARGGSASGKTPGATSRLSLRADPLALADLRALDPRLPENGVGSLDLVARIEGKRRELDASEVRLRAGDATLDGHGALVTGDTLLVRDTDLRFARIATSLLATFAPEVRRGRQGELTGRIRVDGTPAAMRLDGDVAFDATRGGRSRVTARGEVGVAGARPRASAAPSPGGTARTATNGAAATAATTSGAAPRKPAREIVARALRVTLDPLRLDALPAGVVPRALAGVLTGRVTVDGSTTSGWRGTLDLTHVDRGERSHVVGRGAVAMSARGGETAGTSGQSTSGMARRTAQAHDRGSRFRAIDVDVRALPLSLVTAGRFAPSLGLHGAVTGPIALAGPLDDLTLRTTLRLDGSGTLSARGRVGVAGRDSRYDLSVSTDSLDPSAVSTRAPRLSLTGEIVAAGHGTDPRTMQSRGEVRLVSSTFPASSILPPSSSSSPQSSSTADIRVDTLVARAQVGDGVLHLDTLRVRTPYAAATAGGAIGLVEGRDGTLAYSIVVDSLGALREWMPPPAAGDTGVVLPRGARYAAAVARARADSMEKAEATRIERLALGLPVGQPLKVDSIPGIRRDSLGGSVSVRGSLRGSIARFDASGHAAGADLVARGNAAKRVDVDYTWTAARAPGSSLDVAARLDGVQARGFAYDSIDARLAYRGGSGSAEFFAREDARHDVRAAATFTRDTAATSVRLTELAARLDTTRWTLARPATVRVGHGVIAADSLELRDGRGGRILADGVVPDTGALRVALSAERVPIEDAIALAQDSTDVRGLLSADVRADGTRASPRARASAEWRDGSVRGVRVHALRATSDYADHLLVARADLADSLGAPMVVADAHLPVSLHVLGDGVASPAAPLAIDLRADSLALALLPLPRVLEKADGVLRGAVQVRGTYESPRFGGALTLHDAAVTVVPSQVRYHDVAASLRVVGDSVVVDSIVARSDGTLAVRGVVGIASPRHPEGALTVTASGLRMLDTRNGFVHGDLDARVQGSSDSVLVTGRANLHDSFLSLKGPSGRFITLLPPGDPELFAPFDTSATMHADSAEVNAIGAKERGLRVELDIGLAPPALDARHANYFRNRPDANVQYYTERDLHLHVDRRRLEMWTAGDVTIGSGPYVFRARPFEMQRGTVTFVPQTQKDAVPQVVAEHTVWMPGHGFITIDYITGGHSSQPHLALEGAAPFPLRAQELSSYLAFGRSPLSLLQQSGSSLGGEATWSGHLSGATGALGHRQQTVTAWGVLIHDLGVGATAALDADAVSLTPSDVPTELMPTNVAGYRGSTLELTRYFKLSTYAALSVRPMPALPGLRVGQRLPLDLVLDLGVEPRFLREPSLGLGTRHTTIRTGLFGAFLSREWSW